MNEALVQSRQTSMRARSPPRSAMIERIAMNQDNLMFT
jgi:hypothetical protein